MDKRTERVGMKNPGGKCQCGCGQNTNPSPTSRRGYKKGEPLLYIKGHSSRKLGPDYLVEDRGHTVPCGHAAHEYTGCPSSCWLWAKSIGSEGYGRIWNGAGYDMAHRVIYERDVGSIAEGHEVHHECGVRACVNPEHLIEVTRAEHMALEGRFAYGNPKARVTT